MKSLYEILIITMLGLSVVGCELLDPKGQEKASEYRRERGRKYYRNQYGNVYCEDTK